MYRKIINDLLKWKNDKNRKPLILRGARQVGKTYIIKQFGSENYEGALNWLKDANLINKIYNVTKPSMPLISYNDLSSFKIYLNDVGLLRKMTDLDSSPNTRIRFSMKNLQKDDNLINIPLFLIEYLEKFI